MRYVFLFYALIVVSAVAIGGFRGAKSPLPPIEIFPDMDRQDKVLYQTTSDFFADGVSSRPPIDGTVPVGHYLPEKALADGATPDLDGYTALDDSYLNTGRFGDFYGSGMPAELGLDESNVEGFLRRGKERYNIYCAVCHGESGNGMGVVRMAGFANISNLHDARFQPESYADGNIYNTIANGKGLMGAYGDKLSIRDRWAVVAWMRALQDIERGIPATEPGVRDLIESAAADQ